MEERRKEEGIREGKKSEDEKRKNDKRKMHGLRKNKVPREIISV